MNLTSFYELPNLPSRTRNGLCSLALRVRGLSVNRHCDAGPTRAFGHYLTASINHPVSVYDVYKSWKAFNVKRVLSALAEITCAG